MAQSGSLFNDPLEDTEMSPFVMLVTVNRCSLFNDPLEDTEMKLRNPQQPKSDVLCSTIR